MERIVLEVDEATAKKWRSASSRLRMEVSRIIDTQISAIIDKKEDKDIIQYLDELRKEMAEKGLTQEILDEILKDNGQ